MIEKVRGLSVEYNVVGYGKPVVIFSNFEETQLEKVFAQKNGYKRIYVHIPGVGKSEVADWMSSSDDVLQILLEFIEQVLGEERFLLIGFSYCGYLAQGIIKMKPEQVDGIAIFYPVVHAAFEKRNIPQEKIVFKDERFLSELNENDQEDISSYILQGKGVLELSKELKSSNIAMLDFEFYNKLKQAGRYGFSFPINPLPAPFQKPALIVMGRQDYVVGYKDGWQLIDSYPRASFSVLDMAGHNLAFEQNELFITMVYTWLNRCNNHENEVYTICCL